MINISADVAVWLFLVGFGFLVFTAVWAIVTITRMKREQVVAIAILNALAARAGLKETIDRIQADVALGQRRRRASDRVDSEGKTDG